MIPPRYGEYVSIYHTPYSIQKYAAKIFHDALLLETQTIISVSFDAVGTQCMCMHLTKTKCFIGGGTCHAKALLNSSEKCVRAAVIQEVCEISEYSTRRTCAHMDGGNGCAVWSIHHQAFSL